MLKLSCFADEISADLHEQVAFLKQNRIGSVDLRGVWDKNVLDLTPGELDRIKAEFDRNGIRTAAVA
ncbi:MAG TPA: xylose isomerase, partial [Clostridiales bacterium]|nr:xylose isomerase [Clostridiales bacterium]